MSDRPSNLTENIPDEPRYQGGWRKPTVPGAWHPPAAAEKPRAAEESASVPTLPADLTETPETEGSWHLPKPEDTVFTTEDQTQAAPEQARVESRPEDMIAGLDLTGERETATTDSAETVASTEEPTRADAPASDSLLALEQAAAGVPAQEDDDDEGMGMSELIALANLIEPQPQASSLPGRPATTDVAAGIKAEDPAAYARRQLEQLGTSGGTAAPASSAAADPAAYARQQLEQLGGAQTPAPVPTAAALSQVQQELAQRFTDTENQVRALRRSYQTGQLTRDQLQEQLKKLMILDDQNVWWMMGVETDTWYRFENNEWIVATPPYAGAAVQPAGSGRVPPPTATSGLDPGQVVGGSLPYLPSEPVAAQPGGFGITEELGLPRRDVPVNDPERTVVSTVGAYLEPVRPSDAQTLVGGQTLSPVTVINPAVSAPYGGVSTPSPITGMPAAGAPDYALDSAVSPAFEDAARRQQQQTMRTVLTLAALGVGALLLLMACGIGFVLIQYSNLANQFQPQVAALRNYQPQFQTARILDANGALIAELNSQQGGSRTTVPLDRISPFMIHAVVSLENERFYDDPGWDWIAIGRAFVQNLTAGQVESGASTITQQIAEQLILKQPTNSPDLKLQELVIASEIAKQYDKNFILQLYLNEIFFGNQSYGVEAASQFYFGHAANDLNLPEAALLAGMISAPVQYNPVRSGGEDLTVYNQRRDESFKRMDFVIQRMQQVGCLQLQNAPYLGQPFCVDQPVVRQATVQKAQVVAAEYRPREVRFKYPHFVQFVQQQIETLFGSGEMFRRGFVVKTTLNPSVQDVAEAALRQSMQSLIATGINTGSIIVTDPRNGAIRAMIGSPNFNDTGIDGQVNGALTWQQPGSAIKPIVYTGALEGADKNGDGVLEYMTPATVLWDVPSSFGNPPYTPVNFDRRYRGMVPFRYALQNSFNIPSVKVYDFIGEAKFRDVASRLGLRFPDGAQFGLATGLGAVEITLYDMMMAYGTLANGGVRVPLYTIESITDSTGQPITLPERAQAQQSIQPQIAYLMANILSDDTARATAFGSNGPLTISGLPTSNMVAAKTGTTNDNRDLWTLGFTRNAVVGVWLGRPDNAPTFVTDGGYGSAAPLWNQVMQAVLRTLPRPEGFVNPGGVVQGQICADTGTLPTPNCTSLRSELFLQSQPPPPADQAFVQRIEVDTWTGLRANEYCPDNKTATTVVNITDTFAVQWLNSQAGAADASRLGITPGAVQNIPTASCDQNTEVPIARIISPAESQTLSGIVQLTGAATALNTFNRYQVEYASAISPTAFTILSGPTTTPQTSGLLGTWNTATVPNGQYILRLAMFANNGGYLYRMVNVTVVNTQPTPVVLPTSPVLFPTSEVGGTPVIQIGFATPTPLPFEQVSP